MDEAALNCPNCASTLLKAQVDHRREYLCPACGSAVITIIVLRQLDQDLAKQLWTADPGPETGPCPFCHRPMKARPTGTGQAAVCRPCEMVAFDKAAYCSITVAAPLEGAPLAGSELRCPQCGAPVANSWDEHCKYCGAGLHSVTKVVVVPADSAAQMPSTAPFGSGFLGRLLDDLMGPP